MISYSGNDKLAVGQHLDKGAPTRLTGGWAGRGQCPYQICEAFKPMPLLCGQLKRLANKFLRHTLLLAREGVVSHSIPGIPVGSNVGIRVVDVNLSILFQVPDHFFAVNKQNPERVRVGHFNISYSLAS